MRKVSAVAVSSVVLALAGAPAAFAGGGNPNGTGPPSQSCQDQLNSGGTTPGNSASSPGSPFNEPGFGSVNGGTGGLNYSPKSQYDVACYHVSSH